MAMFEEEFGGRILPFDSAAAPSYARIAAQRRRAGRPISHFEAQIAAIAVAAGAALATRNVADFDRCGVKVINPGGPAQFEPDSRMGQLWPALRRGQPSRGRQISDFRYRPTLVR